MIARAAAPMTTREPIVARGAPAVVAPGGVLEAGLVGAPVDDSTVVVTVSEETGGTMSVVVADAGGAPGASEDGAPGADGAGTAGGAPPEVGIG
jgi:hypothetical protein